MTAWNVEWLDEIDSTNNELKRRMDAPHGTVLAARRQTGGKGRLGRSFCSPEGGVYLSALLRPEVSPEQLLHLTAMAGVAARRAIAALSGIEAGIKWVNDLVYDGKKLCGILVEWCGSAAIIGIGINCSTVDFPAELRASATSLRLLTGRDISPGALAEQLAQELRAMDAALLTGRDAWLAEYAAHCVTLGKPVRLLRGGEDIGDAFAVGIDAQGGLRVRYDNGTEAIIRTGEVSVRGAEGYV